MEKIALYTTMGQMNNEKYHLCTIGATQGMLTRTKNTVKNSNIAFALTIAQIPTQVSPPPTVHQQSIIVCPACTQVLPSPCHHILAQNSCKSPEFPEKTPPTDLSSVPVQNHSYSPSHNIQAQNTGWAPWLTRGYTRCQNTGILVANRPPPLS